MIPETRNAFNAAFTQQAYEAMLADLNKSAKKPIEFRIAETPVFIPEALKARLVAAGQDLIKTITSGNFKQLTEKAIPPQWQVANENDHPHFLAFDFAVVRDATGELTPRLIELQGFPSLFAYQNELADQYRKHFPATADLMPYLEPESEEAYFDLLRRTIVGNHKPDEVILLDIHASEQKTAVDFHLTAKHLGIVVVSLDELRQQGEAFFYTRNGNLHPVKRIYNRLIFDEIPDKQQAFKNVPDLLTSDKVEWLTHPNWFYRISKYTMPFLKSEFVPETRFLSDIKFTPANLENYVLKPLFSFAGQGVKIDVTESDLQAIPDPENWILQEKVTYESVIESPDGLVKCEIRLMYLWPDGDEKPTLAITLTRLSRGKMIGVDFNRNFDWVGGSVGLFKNA